MSTITSHSLAAMLLLLSTPTLAAADGAPGQELGNADYRAAPAPPSSQGAVPKPRGRHGFIAGLGFGLGTMSGRTESLGTAGGYELHLGGMLNPKAALIGELWFHSVALGAESTLNRWEASVAAQYWPHSRVWLRGGFGASLLSMTYSGAVGGSFVDEFDDWIEGRDRLENGTYGIDSGSALYGAGGYEFYRGPSLAIDVQARYSTAVYRDIDARLSTFMVMSGLNWY